MRQARIGGKTLSGLCIGGNPFSGFSHQGPERTREMVEYYTIDCIKATLQAAEAAGINTFFGRTDDHIMGLLREYWDAGGGIQWFAQVSPGTLDEVKSWLRRALDLGAAGAYIHGGVVDNWYAEEAWSNFDEILEIMRATDAAAGFAGHEPRAHEWIRDHLDVDFQMCCHYNPTDRSRSPEHNPEGEVWDDEARREMLEVVAAVPGPVAHYKIFAAGNKPILPAFELLGQVMRANDVAVVGVFPKDDPNMIAKDAALFEQHVG